MTGIALWRNLQIPNKHIYIFKRAVFLIRQNVGKTFFIKYCLIEEDKSHG